MPQLPAQNCQPRGEGVRAKLTSDLVQETFAQAQKIFDRFEGKSSQEFGWAAGCIRLKKAERRSARSV
jgi:DNA-directed RNA polymerase specialized sigma24 family protein